MTEKVSREPLLVSREQAPTASMSIATCIDGGICVIHDADTVKRAAFCVTRAAPSGIDEHRDLHR
jgi:hypothetical protein